MQVSKYTQNKSKKSIPFIKLKAFELGLYAIILGGLK